VLFVFPTGFNIVTAKLVAETGLPVATSILISLQTINYTFAATSFKAGTSVFFIFQGIQNPSSAGTFSSTATVQTRDGKVIVDSGTSTTFSIRQLGGADISKSSSLTIAALSTGTLTVSGAATFKSTVTTTGLLTANGGVSTTSLSATLAKIGSLSLSGSTLSAKGTNVNLYLSSSDGTKLLVGLGNSPLSLYDHLGNLLLSVDGLGVIYTKQIDVTGSSSIFLNSGIICAGTGSTPCGGKAELDSSGALYASNGAFSVSSGGVLSAAAVSASSGIFAGFYIQLGNPSVFFVDNSGDVISSGALSVAKGLFGVDSTGQIITKSVGFNSLADGALPIVTFGCQAGTVSNSCPDVESSGTVTAPGHSDSSVSALVILDATAANNGCTFCGGQMWSNILELSAGSGETFPTEFPDNYYYFFVDNGRIGSGSYEYVVSGMVGGGTYTFSSDIFEDTSTSATYYVITNTVMIIWLPGSPSS